MTSVTTQCNNPLNGLCKKPLFFPLLLALSLSALEVGKPAPEITGGRLDGSSWSSSELQGKVHLLFYVDAGKIDSAMTQEVIALTKEHM